MRCELEMAALLSTDVIVGIAAVVVAAVAVYLFVRATGKPDKPDSGPVANNAVGDEPVQPLTLEIKAQEKKPEVPQMERHLRGSDVESARSSLRTLTLKQELLSMVMKRLFEAEDEGEITREERLRLSRDYEAEMKGINEELKRAELIVTLNELEAIREDIIKKFESTLNNTQARIDSILKELKIEEPEKEPPKPPRKKKAPEKEESQEEEEAEEEAEEEPEKPQRKKSDIEDKLDQLRQEVLKELEELDKLEIEV